MGEGPVFLFAYANNVVEGRQYLRKLNNERRRILEVLKPAVEAQRCELEVIQDATFKAFTEACEQHKDRIAVVHFAGHGSSSTLIFEDDAEGTESVSAAGIASFIATLGSIPLVFLNACGTREQAESLREGGVGAVVATSDVIEDSVAATFAESFYGGVALGWTVEASFKKAAHAASHTARGANPIPVEQLVRSDYRDVILKSNAPEPMPWNIYGDATSILLGKHSKGPWAQIALAALAIAIGIGVVAVIASMKGENHDDSKTDRETSAPSTPTPTPPASSVPLEASLPSKIFGYVVNYKKERVPDAGVRADGCTSTTTDADGGFTLQDCKAQKLAVRGTVFDAGPERPLVLPLPKPNAPFCFKDTNGKLCASKAKCCPRDPSPDCEHPVIPTDSGCDKTYTCVCSN